jgi:hypothetical protein
MQTKAEMLATACREAIIYERDESSTDVNSITARISWSRYDIDW